MTRITGIVLCLASLLIAVQASEFEHKYVQNIGDDFNDKVKDGKLYFLKLYAPWCGHCKRLAPTWGELAEAFASDSDVVIGHVDCTVARDVCSKEEIRGYPTLKIYHKGEGEQYKGGRDLGSLRKFVDEKKASLLAGAAA